MFERSPSLQDEDTLQMPKSWKRHLHPRRGGLPGPKIRLTGQGEEELRSLHAAEIEKVLAKRPMDPALTAAAREHLAGEPLPLGAAVVAAIPDLLFHSEGTGVRFVDAWVTTYGLRFATHAFLDRCDIMVGPYGAGKSGVVSARGRDVMPRDAAKRLRALLAVAPEAEYRDVVDLLAQRRTTPMQKMISVYLVPTELRWVAECCAAPGQSTGTRDPKSIATRELLLRSLGSPEHLKILGSAARISVSDCYHIENLISLADGVGPAIAPYLAEAFDEHHDEPRRRKALLDVLGRLPSDEAFWLMLERATNQHMRTALRESIRLYPVRAMRILATAVTSGDVTAEELLTDHLRANAGLVAEAVAQLSVEVRDVVRKLSAVDGRVPQAQADELPRLLVDPPWARPEPEPVVLKGLMVPEGQSMVVWAPGERDGWLDTCVVHDYLRSWINPPQPGWCAVGPVPPPQERSEKWERWVSNFRAGRVDEEASSLAGLFAMGPEELIRPLLREWQPGTWERARAYEGPEDWLKVLLARFELDALPVAWRFARAKPARGAALLMPFLDGRIANAMADWLLRAKTVEAAAVAWFERHGRGALPYLVPVALGKAGRARTAAEHALLLLADRHGKEAVLDAARHHGERAATLMETLLDRDRKALDTRRKVPADLGVHVESLPQVLLRGRERALPVPAVRHLLRLLAISAPEGADSDLAPVLRECDEDSLAEFGWELFRQWRENGASPEHAWQFTALGWLGDDETVRRLVPLIHAWPGQAGHHHAVRGLDVLARIGSALALRSLHGIAQNAEYQGLWEHAHGTVERLAVARGLTPQQFVDRLSSGV